MNVEMFFRQWLDLRRAALAPRTVESYADLIARFIAPALGAVELDQLRGAQLQELFAAVAAQGKTRTAQLLRVLCRAALADAARCGLADRNAADQTLTPRHIARAARYWSPEELRAFIAASASSRWCCAWLLAMLCGLRRGEIAGLRWGDVDFAAGVIRIRNQRQRVAGAGVIDSPPKSRAGFREIPLPLPLADQLRALYASQQIRANRLHALPCYVIAYQDLRPIDPHALNRALAEDIARARVRAINLHGLRHSFATAAIAAGCSMKVLQSLLGHASYTTTADIYAHVLRSDQTAAIDNLTAIIYNAKQGKKPQIGQNGT